MTTNLPVKLEHLPNSLPLDGAVCIELIEGIPIFRASTTVIERIETCDRVTLTIFLSLNLADFCRRFPKKYAATVKTQRLKRE